jgi:hypothetical protein
MGAQFQTIKAVFNGGEMSPLMDGRTDSEKYATGCRLLENFIVRSYGGIFKRPGLKFGLKNTGNAWIRLIPFRRSTTINFVLAFKLNEIKVYSYAAGVFTLVSTLTTTYTEAEIPDIHFVQLNDIMYLTVATHHPKIITRATDGTWSFANVPFQFAPALDPPDDAVTMTLVYDANDWVTLTAYVIGDFVLNGGLLYRCITANSDAAFTGAKWTVANYRQPWNVDASVTAYAVGDVVEYFGSNYWCITAHGPATSANRPGTGAQWVLIPFTDYRLTSSSATFDANEVGSTWQLSPGSTKRMVFEPFGVAAATVTTAAAFIQGDYLVRTNWSSGSAPSLTTVQLQESIDRLNFTTIKEWRIQGVQEGTISYTATAPNTGGWYRLVTIRDTGGTAVVATDDTMSIEPAVAKLDIPFLIQSYVSTTQVRGIPKLAVDSLIPNEVIGAAFPVWRKGAFSITRGYPRTCSFHDSRLWYACTATEPMRIWGSQTDDYYTFLTGALDTSGIDVTMAATQANDIQWLASFKKTMVIGTTGEEWTMDSGDQDSALTPSNVRLRRWSRYGSSKHQPVLSGDGLLWLTRDNRLREFAYKFESDGYSAPEMTLLAEHIPSRSDVVQMGYSQSPDPIVWLVHADGTWSGFTYDRENNVTAWHRHRTGGAEYGDTIKSLCTLYSTSTASDSLIFLTSRNGYGLESIDGANMNAAMTSADLNYAAASPTQGTRGKAGFYLDAYLTDSGGGSSTTIMSTTASSGMQSGRACVLGVTDVTATGLPITATAGASTVTFAVANDGLIYNFGLPYTAWAIPNRMEVPLRDGTAQMKKWRISRAAFRLWRSFFGQAFRKTADVDYTYASRIETTGIDAFPISPNDAATTTGYVNGQTLPQSLNFDWGNAVDIVIASKHPLPFNLLAMVLEVELDGTSGAGA